MKAGRWVAVAAVAVGVIGASMGHVLAQGDERSEVAHAWIDDPLDGSSFPVGPIAVVAHATSERGLAAVELNVDEVLVDSAAGGSGLVRADFTWTPPGPGVYRLVVRAVERPAFAESDPVTIVVGGSPEDAALAVTGTLPTTVAPTTAPPTTNPTGGPSTTPTTAAPIAPTTPPRTTATARTTAAPPTTQGTRVTTTVARTTSPPPPTEPPCDLAAPALDFPTGGTSVSDRTPTLLWVPGNSCPIDDYRVVVSEDRDLSTTYASGTSADENWTIPDGSALENCTTYYWRVRARADGSDGPWSDVGRFVMDAGGC